MFIAICFTRCKRLLFDVSMRGSQPILSFDPSFWRPVKRWIKSHMPQPVERRLRALQPKWFTSYATKSFSQEGEDLVLERFLDPGRLGFYVDVGAHHPVRFSNTYRLYRRGWRGLNIDANPGSMKRCERLRPRDLNVEAAAASSRQELTYYIFDEPALNTLNKELALELAGNGYSIAGEVNVTALTLWQLLDQHVPPETRITYC
jgi:hypothetical protein